MSPRMYVGACQGPATDKRLRLRCVPHGQESTCSPCLAPLHHEADQSISGAGNLEAQPSV